MITQDGLIRMPDVERGRKHCLLDLVDLGDGECRGILVVLE
jgi:hypothetical protein